MTTFEKRLKRNVARNQVLDRELDYLPATVDRDDVRELARKYGPQKRRSIPIRAVLGATDFILRYSSPFIGMIAGAEYAAARALYPLIGEEQRPMESLRLFLGEDAAKRIEDTNKAFKVTGTLVAATPEIVSSALYGAVAGILVYCLFKWSLMSGASFRRNMKLRKSLRELLS